VIDNYLGGEITLSGEAIPADETLGEFEMRIAALPDDERWSARKARMYRNTVWE
jgi:hypothetical protein